MCCDKVTYRSQRAAERIMHRQWQRPDGKKKPIRAYRCKRGAWHLTSKPKRVTHEPH